jgi:hypothetical protein
MLPRITYWKSLYNYSQLCILPGDQIIRLSPLIAVINGLDYPGRREMVGAIKVDKTAGAIDGA